METFKLNNLRELSTEEQLRLQGGANGIADCACGTCSCATCSCNDQQPSGTVSNTVTETTDGVKYGLAKLK